MSRRAVVMTLAYLTAAYQRDLDDATIELYIEHLEDIDDKLLDRVARDLVVRSKWFPTIAVIREQAAKTILGDCLPPEASTAWGEVIRAATSQGRSFRPQWSHPMIALALDEVGGYHEVCMSTHVESIRLRFERVFDRLRRSTIESVQVARFDYRETPRAITSRLTPETRQALRAFDPPQPSQQEAGETVTGATQGD